MSVFFSAYFINMNLQPSAHSYQFTNLCFSRKEKLFDARLDFKNCKNSCIGHFTVSQIFSLMKACNCRKSTTFDEAKQNILLPGDRELNISPTSKKSHL